MYNVGIKFQYLHNRKRLNSEDLNARVRVKSIASTKLLNSFIYITYQTSKNIK